MENLRAEKMSRSPKRKRDGKDIFFCGRVRRNPEAVTTHRGDMNSTDFQKKILREVNCPSILNKE